MFENLVAQQKEGGTRRRENQQQSREYQNGNGTARAARRLPFRGRAGSGRARFVGFGRRKDEFGFGGRASLRNDNFPEARWTIELRADSAGIGRYVLTTYRTGKFEFAHGHEQNSTLRAGEQSVFVRSPASGLILKNRGSPVGCEAY